jgi:hypothetical protein
MGELSSSIAEAFRKRAVSSAFGTYLFFWVSVHWQGIYVTLFTGEDLIYKQHRLLKNEYVNQYFFGWHGWKSILEYILPLLFTALFIWILPKYILIHAYRQEQRHKVAKRKVKIEEEELIELKKEDLAIQERKTLEAEVVTAKKKQQVAKADPRIIWEREFRSFKLLNKEYAMFSEILRAIYEHNGVKQVEDGYGNIVFRVSPQSMRTSDVMGLIVISDSGHKLSLTEKGKFFASRYDKDL